MFPISFNLEPIFFSLILSSLLISVFKSQLRFFSLLFVFLYLFFLSFRSVDYNTDTYNYYQHFLTDLNLSLLESFLIKFEPFHYGLLYFQDLVFSSFHFFIFLENFFIFIFIFFVFRLDPFMVYPVLLGMIFPLLDSSFRLSLLLSALSYFLLKYRFDSYFRQISFSIFLALFHISGLAYFFINSLSFRVFFIPFILLSVVFVNESLSRRLGVDFSFDLSGLKFYAVSLFISFLYFIFGYRSLVYRFLASQTFLLLFASFVFSMANRWMMFVILISIIGFHFRSRDYLSCSFKFRSSFFICFILLSFPNVYFSFGVSV